MQQEQEIEMFCFQKGSLPYSKQMMLLIYILLPPKKNQNYNIYNFILKGVSLSSISKPHRVLRNVGKATLSEVSAC